MDSLIMFGRKPKAAPTVKTDWFDLVLDQRSKNWTLSYQGIEFSFEGIEVTLPKKSDLDMYIEWVEANREHIDGQVEKLTEPWEDVVIDASKAHVALIEVEGPKRIAVMILGDDTWGDMGYDLWLEDGEIVKEGFGD
jgi:hypothetical protein